MRCDECGESINHLPVPGQIHLCDACEAEEASPKSIESTRSYVAHGSLIPSRDISGERCFEAYDDQFVNVGCFRTQEGAERELTRRWHRWDLKGLAV